jgi:hypothetical protein
VCKEDNRPPSKGPCRGGMKQTPAGDLYLKTSKKNWKLGELALILSIIYNKELALIPFDSLIPNIVMSEWLRHTRWSPDISHDLSKGREGEDISKLRGWGIRYKGNEEILSSSSIDIKKAAYSSEISTRLGITVSIITCLIYMSVVTLELRKFEHLDLFI